MPGRAYAHRCVEPISGGGAFSIRAGPAQRYDQHRRPLVQIARSLLMLGSNLLYVAAIGRVPLATGSAVGFTVPLLVTALSVPLLRESVGWQRWSAVLVGFAGALIVIRP